MNISFAKTASSVGLVVGFFLLVFWMFFAGLDNLVKANEAHALKSTSNAVKKAIIQFYAIEGYYPPSLDYLVQHHGISPDNQRFIIHYSIFASNIMPRVVVFPRR